MAVITKDTFDPLHRYVGVRLQQGVPIVDADWNEMEDVRKFELRAYLKWFVGNGIPEGNDGFRISASGAANDFTINAGIGGAADGLNNIGRCLVEGLDVMIDGNFTYRSQALHVSKGVPATQLAGDWGVPVIDEVPNVNGVVTIFLDVWERLIAPTDEPSLVLPGLSTESCARMKREYVVRTRQGTALPATGNADFREGHGYYALATINRHLGVPAINQSDLTDRREQRLLVPPATLITDLLGINPIDYRRGVGRPLISFREAINALMRGDLPSTPDTAIVPDPANDFMSYAFPFAPDGSVYAVWHSARVAPNQVFAARWNSANPAAGFVGPAQQVTTGGAAHALPHAVVLPTGDLLVVYETGSADIHYKHASLAGLNAAPEIPLAVTADTDRHPFVVLAPSTNRVIFFWHRTGAPSRWFYRIRQYTPTWTEADAIWLTVEAPLSAATPASPALARGEFHAAADGNGDTWVAYRTSSDDIQALQVPALGGVVNAQVLSTANADQVPFVLVDGNATVYVFWQAGTNNGINYQRFLKASNTWEAGPTLAPDTTSGTNNIRPCAARDSDGAIWLFWANDRSATGNNDIWFMRRNPNTGGWGQARQIVGSPLDDTHPFAAVAPGGVLWLFWRSNRAGVGNYDLFFKQIVTTI
ncbi:MAG TPA: DUF6519 domain-containing protein [Blastocatellia bacterium]|nr:DUF6519 domain-containing protein [Blastocatellia bacterium]